MAAEKLSYEDHCALALWAAACAERVLAFFETERPDDRRPRRAIEAARAWVRGDIPMIRARTYAFAAHTAAREVDHAARAAARAAGHAAATAHVAGHACHAASYAVAAARAAAQPAEAAAAVAAEHEWQRAQLPAHLHYLGFPEPGAEDPAHEPWPV